jgi:plasmid replication initiation protein
MRKEVMKTVPEAEDESALAHELTRAAYRLPIMQARVLQVALSQLRPNDKEFPTVEMPVGDILRALKLDDNRQYRESIRSSVDGLMRHVIDVGNWETGWEKFHLVERAKYIKTRDSIQVLFSDEIADFALNLKGLFTMISNEEFSRLTSEYAIRIFQLVSSWKDKAGKDGNKPGCWWWDTDFDTLRHLVKVPTEAYRGANGTNNFRNKVIDGPVQEINAADLGLTVEIEYKRRGRSIVGVRFNCKMTSKAKPIGKVPSAPEKAVLKLRESKRWKEIFHLLQAQKTLPGFETLDADDRRAMDEAKADQLLAEELK